MMFILYALAAAIAALLVFAVTKPDSFRLERSITVKATPEKIFSYLNNLRKGEKWSPWEDKDPDMRHTYTGPESGVGATQEWNGNKQVGQGRMTIVESVENEKVVVTLDFIAPFKAHNMAELSLKPSGDQTTIITWAMYGPQPFIGKI